MSRPIKNFCIISHIDHGKSTLADRFLELTGRVDKNKMQAQHLDSMDLEREKGITIKMHPVRLEYNGYILNLIDTPGHIDFSYEISRALACAEGVILLVDGQKGIQAQTLFNLEQAKNQGLKIIGVINKIDVADKEQIEGATKELAHILECQEKDIFLISAKTGAGVAELLEVVIKELPSPDEVKQADKKAGAKALIFDSKYDSFSGVIAYVRVFEGEIKAGDKITFLATGHKAEAKEVGYFIPNLEKGKVLRNGEIGYIKTGIKEPAKVKVGDTIATAGVSDNLPGYKEPQLVLYLSLYPESADDFELLKDALSKLKLNDPTLNFLVESQMALGRGFRIGFLGTLHAEIVVRRLKAEFDLDLLLTAPQVVFEVLTNQDKELFVSSASDWPEAQHIKQAKEPWVELEIIAPQAYFGSIFKIFEMFNVDLINTNVLSKKSSLLICHAPLREIVTGEFYDKLKSVSQGYASFAFKLIGSKKANLVKVDILIAGSKEEAFARILPQEKAFAYSKKFLSKLKETLPIQQFKVALQAAIGGKVIARETLTARRKDVTGALYGGDITRKRKLLDIQKKGKAQLKEKGRVNIPPKTYLEIFKS